MISRGDERIPGEEEPIVPGEPISPEALRPLAEPGDPTATPMPEVVPLHHGTVATPPHPAHVQPIAPDPDPHGHTIQEVAHDVEEEVEGKAAVGFLGGPVVWGLLVILGIIAVYYVGQLAD